MYPERAVTAARPPGRRRLLALTLVVALGAIALACQPVKQSAPPPPGPPSTSCAPTAPANAAQYQAAFDRLFATNTAGWVASDGGLPVPLPDGRILWLFGDTVIGSRAPNGSVGGFLGIANNGFVIQDGRCFRPVTEPIPDPGSNQWIWPTAAVVEGNGASLLVVGQHMRRTGSGDFDFAFVRVAVATFSLPGLTLQGSPRPLPVPATPAPAPQPNYGESIAVVEDGGSWIHAYGEARRDGPLLPIANHYVARTPLGQLLNPATWEFWHDDPLVDGDEGWLPNDPAGATPMLFDGDPDESPAAAFPVARMPDGTYLGSALRFDVLSTAIDTWVGPTPQGPWTKQAVPAADIAHSVQGEDQFAYGGRVVFDVPGAPIALWSVNHVSFAAVLADANRYKVWFATPDPASLPSAP